MFKMRFRFWKMKHRRLIFGSKNNVQFFSINFFSIYSLSSSHQSKRFLFSQALFVLHVTYRFFMSQVSTIVAGHLTHGLVRQQQALHTTHPFFWVCCSKIKGQSAGSSMSLSSCCSHQDHADQPPLSPQLQHLCSYNKVMFSCPPLNN